MSLNLEILARLNAIHDRIRAAAERTGRDPGDVKLLAVSKTFPYEAISQVYACGQIRFGENRVSEMQEKAIILSDAIEWHLIGHLQSNKADTAAHYAQWIHSVDSVKLIHKLNDAAAKYNRNINVLLEINSGEDQKDGLRAEDDVRRCIEAALQSPNLSLQGFMTMAAMGASDPELHHTFQSLRLLRDRMSKEFGIVLPHLSMGMSSDFEQAIEEGATIVRIGTAIFGGRTSHAEQ